eukprot:6338206-Alexandrium_andersonii.AAC.1
MAASANSCVSRADRAAAPRNNIAYLSQHWMLCSVSPHRACLRKSARGSCLSGRISFIGVRFGWACDRW